MELGIIGIKSKLTTLKSRLLFSAVFFLISTLVSVATLSYYLYLDTATKKVYNSNQNYNIAIDESISSVLQETLDYCDGLISDPQLNKCVEEFTSSNIGSNTSEFIKKLNYTMLSAMEYRKEIVGISIITETRSFSKGYIPQVSYKKISDEQLFGKLENESNRSLVMQGEYIKSFDSDDNADRSIYVAGVAKKDNIKWFVMIKMNAEFFAISKQNVRTMVLDEYGKVVWTSVENDRDGLVKTLIKRQNRNTDGNFIYHGKSNKNYVSYNVSNYNGWTYASIMDSQNFSIRNRKVLFFTIFAGLVLLLVFSAASVIVCSWLVTPLTRLGERIRNIRDLELGEIEDDKKIGAYWLNKINFKGKLMLFYSLLIVISSFTYISVFFKYSQSVIAEQVKDTAIESIYQTAKNIDFIMSKSERISAYISINEDIQSLMTLNGGDDEPDKDISSYIINERFLKKGINYIDIYNAEWGKIYSTSPLELYGNPLDEKLLENFNEATFHKQWLRMKEGIIKDFTISFVRKVRAGIDAKDRYSVIGYIDLGLDESYISQKYRMLKWGEKSRTLITDASGIVLSSEDKNAIGKSIYDIYPEAGPGMKSNMEFISGSEVLHIISEPISIFEWNLISIIPQREMTNDYVKVLTANIIALFVIIIIMLEIVNVFANWISRPIYIIKRGINEIKIGNLDVEIDYKGYDEFGALCSSFKDMMGRLDSLFNELYEGKLREKDLENRKKEAQLICLQHQINPHFLYNTFASIKFLIKMGRTEEAAEMVNKVGDMFRTGVYRGQMLVSIREEIDHIRSYLTIQQIRYMDKLKVEWEIDESVYEYGTLKFILQPIIENAIYHGIELLKDSGLLQVKAANNNSTICFEITDNGPGIASEKLKLIYDQLEGREKVTSIGLKNVDERIKMYFGQDYGLKIQSNPGTGTIVKLIIPAFKTDAAGLMEVRDV